MHHSKGLLPVNLSRTAGAVLLSLVCAAFVSAKLPHLDYPFYWDESWSYAPGVQLMYAHGPSLLPDAIDTLYSRGHPLAFYAAAAAWMSVFGPSHASMHSFALAVAVGCIVAVYVAGSRLGGRWVGLLGAGVLASQLIFFVQAAFVLPEVMLALLTLLSLHAWAARQSGWLALWLSLLLLTKESGGMTAAVIGIAAVAELMATRLRNRVAWRMVAAIFMAGTVIGAFFALQKHVHGWYFFPEHMGMMQWEWGAFYGKFRASLHVLCFEDQRAKIFAALISIIIAYCTVKRNPRPLLLLFPAGATYWVEEYGGWERTKLLFTFWILSSIAAVLGLLWAYSHQLPLYARRFVIVSAPWWVAYISFCSLNFFTGRYLLSPLAPAILMGIWMMYVGLRAMAGQVAPAIVALVGAVTATLAYYTDTGLGDTDREAFNAMRAQQAGIHYLETHRHYEHAIAATSFQNREHLTKPLTGFLSGARTFSQVTGDPYPGTKLVLFDNIEPSATYEAVTRSGDWMRIFRYTRGKAWTEVWIRTQVAN